jgi:hypothetical protein
MASFEGDRMTINVVGALSSYLKEKHSGFVVYTEEQKQGTDGEDAFYILHTLSVTPGASGRVWLHALMTLRAVRTPSDGRPRAGLYQLGQELLQELQIVPVSLDEDWKARTKDLQYEIVGTDLIVTYSVDFSAFLSSEEQSALIEEATVNVYEKEE